MLDALTRSSTNSPRMSAINAEESRGRVEAFTRKHHIALLTMLFTDVVGSTRLKQVLGDREAIELIRRHHALIREFVARFPEAEEIGTAGDSFFVVFAKPSDAAHCALLMQNGMRRLREETGHPVLDRVGIHVGEVFVQQRGETTRDLFGIQIDTAARVMSLGGADQILLSRFAFDSARQILRGFEIPEIRALSWLNHGYYELKGVEDPVEVCEVGETDLATLAPPKDSEKAKRFRSPTDEPVVGWWPAAGEIVPNTKWKLECTLGEGGFGEVWLARHEQLKQKRVIKFCLKAERARSLKREVTLFRVLRERIGEHPNIVAIHDVFFDEPPFYLVMDYVEGPTLDRWFTAQPAGEAALRAGLEVIAQIADALQAAHDSGIVHRDVKPSNVLVDQHEGAPRAKLTDFGIGQVVNAEALAGVTRLGFTQTMLSSTSASGTQIYLAPEILSGQAATTRSDIYSLGVVLWQMVTGDFTRPLTGDWMETISDPLLRDDIQGCVAGDPQRRFAGAAQLATRLRTLNTRRAAQEEEKARIAALERRAYRRGLIRAALAACAILILIATLALRAHWAAREARAALAMSYVTRAEESDQKGNGAAALAFLASATELDPDSAPAADRLWFILTQRFWPRPLGVSMRGEGVTSVIAFSRDGNRIAVGSTDGTLRLWDTGSSRAIAVPERHGKIVFSASFSPDQTRFATASRDGTARIWSAKDGQPVSPWLRHDDTVLCAAFSSDSQLLATGSTDKQVRIWKATDGSPVGIPLIHDTEVSAVAFSPSDPTILLSAAGKKVRLWSHATGVPGHLLSHPDAVLSVEFDSGGKRILTACDDGLVREWDTASGQTALELTRSSETLDRAFYSPDARTIAVIAGQSLRISSRGSDEPLTLNAGARIRRAAFSSDGARLISGTDNGQVQVWGADSGAAIGEPIRESRQIEGLAFAQDGHILLGTNHGTSRLWAAPSGLLPPARLAHQHAVESALLSTDGERLLTGGTGATIWNLRDKNAAWRLPQGHPAVRQVAWSYDGLHFVTITGDQVQLWQTATGTALGQPMSFDAEVSTAAFRPDGRTLALGTAGGAIAFHSVADGQRVSLPTAHTAKVSALAWSPNGTRCVTASWDGRIKVWNSDSGQLVREADTGEEVACAAASRDGDLVATGGASGAIQIWNVATLSRLAEAHQQRRITAVAFSPDSSILVTASDDGTAAVWDSRSGKARFQLAPHSAQDSMTSVAFSADGRRLATGSANGSAIVWDAETGRQLSEPMRHSDSITSVTFNPRGDRLITSALDRRVCLWDVQTPDGRAERKAIARFARTIIPVKLSPSGHLERQELDFPQNHPGAAPPSLKKLIEWFYGDRFARGVSPFSSQSVQSSIAELLSENRPESLREAAVLASGDSQLEASIRKLMPAPEN